MSDDHPPITVPSEMQHFEKFLQLTVRLCRAEWEFVEGVAYEAASQHDLGLRDNPFKSETKLISLALAWDMGIGRAMMERKD
jgi:hypothetical protein